MIGLQIKNATFSKDGYALGGLINVFLEIGGTLINYEHMNYGFKVYVTSTKDKPISIDFIQTLKIDKKELSTKLSKSILLLNETDYLDEIIYILKTRNPIWDGKITIYQA